MLPAWTTRPEFTLFLALTSPVWYWIVTGIGRRIRSWHASLTEATARRNLDYLQQSLKNPPKLLESLAFIICALPLPFAVAFTALALYFNPFPKNPTPPFDPQVTHVIARDIIWFMSVFAYAIFAVLTVHGIKVAWRMRWGAEHYADTYKKDIRKRIVKLKRKFPQLTDYPKELTEN